MLRRTSFVEMKKLVQFLVLTLSAIYGILPDGHATSHISRSLEHQVWDGNNISTIMGNHGKVVSHHLAGDSGLEWPKGSGIQAIFSDGIWLASGIANGNEEYRTAACEYRSEFLPGMSGSDPESSGNRIYMLSADDGPASTDWIEWPVDQGAPWIDNDGDGIYDPNIDEPDIIGDLFYWYVMNDTSQQQHDVLYKSEPMGVEVRASVFGFDNIYPLENTLFIKWNITNVGDTYLDSVFVGKWSDPDLGDANDDFTGFDTTLGLAYCYNDKDDLRYGLNPPAAGYVMLQTPIIPSPGDTAWVSGNSIYDYVNISVHAFMVFIRGDDFPTYPENAREIYNIMNGYRWNGEPIFNPITNEETHYLFTGDPVTGEGWMDYHMWPSGDRRFLMSAGPFALAPGETQEVVEAIVISQGASDILSVASLKEDVKWVKNTWESNFTKLGAPATIQEHILPHNTETMGPFNLQFLVKPNPGWTSAPSWLFYQVNGVTDSTNMLAVNDTIYEASIPEFSNVTGTTECRYWIKVVANTSTTMIWPSASPPNYNSFQIGPDTTAPVLSGLSNTRPVHYQLPTQQKIHILSIEDDRFGIHPPQLNWQVNGGNVVSVNMVMDSSYSYIGYAGWGSWKKTWCGFISESVGDITDHIFYWVTAQDSSQSQNEGLSVIKQLDFSDRDTIGYWNDAHYIDVDNWDMFNHGNFQSGFTYGGVNWENVIASRLSSNDDTGDTMTYTRSLDLTGFDDVWLTIPMAAYFRDDKNYGVIEFSDDGEIWAPQQTFTGLINPRWIHYDLSDYTSQDHFQFRFRIHCESLFTEWIIDDIVLHSDSTVLNTNPNSIIPNTFRLLQNYPNPFNPTTTIQYELPYRSYVHITIYDLLGRKVTTLVSESQDAGFKSVIWNATNDKGKPVSAGVYLYQIKAGEFVQTRRMVLLK